MIKYVKNSRAKKCAESIKDFGNNIDSVLNFHKTLPRYSPTPLVELKNLANFLGVKNIYIKDESKRFGLNAFKVLGGSYAIGKYIADKLNMSINELPYQKMVSSSIRQKLGDITFITATDGNHGRGIAYIANKLKQKCIVLMPKGSSKIRLENIRKEGASASIENLNYDDCVRKAESMAKKHGYVLVQDSAWEGYEEIPLHIMEGYLSIVSEFFTQIKDSSLPKPTHLFLQAGVGSFAGAISGIFAKIYGDSRPITIICEPNAADCIYKSFLKDDGKPHSVTGDLSTIMAGLACGDPNIFSFEILKDCADFSISCDDSISAHGIRVLSSPLKGDKRIVSGESGSVGLGVLSSILNQKDKYKKLIEDFGLNSNSVVLCISTEGDTDEKNYQNIVWNGIYPNT